MGSVTLYLDCEFNGHNGELISMAIVSPQGHEWYECQFIQGRTEDWVAANVMPKLGKRRVPWAEFRESLRVFMGQFDNPKIVCDWPADLTHFCQVLCGASYAESFYFPFSALMLVTPPGEPKPDNPHNALSDAKALMRWHQGLPTLNLMSLYHPYHSAQAVGEVK